MATIQIDTREKQRAIENILKTFNNAGVKHISSKMYVGDYTLLENPLLVIDRKQGLGEIAKNATAEHGRLKRELQRLDDMGGKMVFLIEQKHYVDPKGQHHTINSLEDIMFWENPYGTVNGVQVYKILDCWQHKHNVSFQFCDKRTTGRRILEILNEGMRTKEVIDNYGQKHKETEE